MADEDVIRRRLLIDGDGTGDDRRLNVLLKTFIKWCNTTNEIPSESQVLLDRMLSQLCQFECALARSRLVARAAADEVNNYKRLSASVEQGLASAREGITATLEEVARAKVVRRQRVRYDALANVISAQPDRRDTAKRLAGLKAELRALEETREMLDCKLDVRRKQFHVLVATIHQLQGMLDEGTSSASIGPGNGKSGSLKVYSSETFSERRGQKRRSVGTRRSKKHRRDEKRNHREGRRGTGRSSGGGGGGGGSSVGGGAVGVLEEEDEDEDEEEDEEDDVEDEEEEEEEMEEEEEEVVEEEEEEREEEMKRRVGRIGEGEGGDDMSAMMDISLDAFEDEEEDTATSNKNAQGDSFNIEGEKAERKESENCLA